MALPVAAIVTVAVTGCAGSPSGLGTDAAPDVAADRDVTPDAAPTEVLCAELPSGSESYSGPSRSRILKNGRGRVPAAANIFGAGRDAPPAPGGGGFGALPPVVPLPPGGSRVVRIPSVTGRVNPIVMYDDWNGPAGDSSGPTDVKSLGGISGIVNRTNGMFLVGVFLTDQAPSDPAPSRLDFSSTSTGGTPPIGERFTELAPEIGQTFLIGNGRGRRYVVPDGATRLFLGFADAYLYVGCPGWYGNNAGHLKVSVDLT